jgi:hypothetical protein
MGGHGSDKRHCCSLLIEIDVPEAKNSRPFTTAGSPGFRMSAPSGQWLVFLLSRPARWLRSRICRDMARVVCGFLCHRITSYQFRGRNTLVSAQEEQEKPPTLSNRTSSSDRGFQRSSAEACEPKEGRKEGRKSRRVGSYRRCRPTALRSKFRAGLDGWKGQGIAGDLNSRSRKPDAMAVNQSYSPA